MPKLVEELPPVGQVFAGTPKAKSDLDIRTRETRFNDLLKFAVPSFIAGTYDTFGTSLGLIDEGDIQAGLASMNDRLGEFYARNGQAARIASDLSTFWLPGLGAIKLWQTGSHLVKATQLPKSARFLNAMLSNTQRSDRLERLIKLRNVSLAKQGLAPLSNKTQQALIKNYKNVRTAETLKEGVAFELGVLATMNESDILYPDEFTLAEIMVLNLAPVGVAAGIERAITNRAVRKQIGRVSEIFAEARNYRTAGVFPQPGNRDISLVTLASARVSADQTAREAGQRGAAQAEEVFRRDVRAFEDDIAKNIDGLFGDNYIPGITEKQPVDPAVKRTVFDTVREDPSSAIGVFSVEKLPDDLARLPADRARTIKFMEDELKKKKTAIRHASGTQRIQLRQEFDLLNRKLVTAKGSEAFVMEQTGEFGVALHRKPMFQDKPQTVDLSSNIFGANGEQGKRLTFNMDGTLGTGSTETFDDLSYFNQTAAYDLIQRAVERHQTVPVPVVLTPQDHFTKLDYGLELLNRYGGKAKVRFAPEFGTIDDVEFLSLTQKFKAYAKSRSATPIKAPPGAKLTSRELAIRFNLPQSTPTTTHPVLDTFEHLRGLTDDLTSVGGLVEFREVAKNAAGIEPTVLRGNAFGLRQPGKAPALLHSRPFADMSVGEYQKFGQEVHRAEVLNQLANSRKYGASFVAAIVDELTSGASSALVPTIKRVETLHEGLQRGTGTIPTQGFTVAEMPAAMAAVTLDETLTKPVRQVIKRLFAEPAKTFGKLRNPANAKSLNLFNHYVHMRRQGWDLAEEAIEQDGRFFFALADTPANQERWRKYFGTSVDLRVTTAAPTAARRGGAYTPLYVDELSLKAAEDIAGLDEVYLLNTNHLRHIGGRGPLTRKPWHVPPKNFAGKNVAYIVDNDNGKVIQVVTGNSDAHALTNARQILAGSDMPSGFVVGQADMEKYFHARDEAFAEMADWTDVLRQNFKTGKGTSVGEVVEVGPGVLSDIVATQEAHFSSVLHRTRSVFFEPELQIARQMGAREALPSAQKAGHTIWAQYTNALLGQKSLNRNATFDQVYYAIEDWVDAKLNAAWTRFHGRQGTRDLNAVKKDFDRIKPDVEFNPYKDAADFARNTHQVDPPWTARGTAAWLNWFTGLLTLRVFDISHALLTLSSLGATQPGVIKALARIPGESMREWTDRIGAYGHVLPESEQGVFSATKYLMSGVHSLFTKEGREVITRAGEKGYLSQTVVEIMNTLTNLERGYGDTLYSRAGEIVTYVSDKSEELARTISFMSAYNVGKRGLKIKDENLLFAFAHRQANESIGNYNPNNRPRMFQGAVGMPLGLFMTFMQNYYQRLFGYIENKQVRASVVQLASQSSVFGAQTIPGFNQYVEYFASNYDGTVNPVDGFRQNFGDTAADVLFYGSLSTAPKLLGAGDGISLYQRGDVNIRTVPSLVTLGDTPIAGMISDTWNAIDKTAGMLQSRGGINAQQMSEILGSYAPVRMVRSMGQLYSIANTGTIADRRGQVINSDAADTMSIVSRMLGMRPLSEAHSNEQFNKIRVAEFARANKLEYLRDRVRSDIRDGNFSESSFKEAVADYLRFGGSPEYFVRWYRQQLIVSQVDRSLLKLKEVLNNPNKMRDVWILMSTLQPSS